MPGDMLHLIFGAIRTISDSSQLSVGETIKNVHHHLLELASLEVTLNPHASRRDRVPVRLLPVCGKTQGLSPRRRNAPGMEIKTARSPIKLDLEGIVGLTRNESELNK
jgi:hypothetical protein